MSDERAKEFSGISVVTEVNQEEGWLEIQALPDQPIYLAGRDSKEYDNEFPAVGTLIEITAQQDQEGDLQAFEWRGPDIFLPPMTFPGVAAVPRVEWELSARNDPDQMEALLSDGWEPFAATQLPNENAKVWFKRLKRVDNGNS